jgi:hypothetical protein
MIDVKLIAWPGRLGGRAGLSTIPVRTKKKEIELCTNVKYCYAVPSTE